MLSRSTRAGGDKIGNMGMTEQHHFAANGISSTGRKGTFDCWNRATALGFWAAESVLVPDPKIKPFQRYYVYREQRISTDRFCHLWMNGTPSGRELPVILWLRGISGM
jgi:hypothetical protein